MKFLLSFVFLAVLGVSCRPKDKIDTFWSWFANNKAIFEHIDSSNTDEKLDLMLEHLHEVKGGLSVEISNEFNGVRDLVISPEGDIKAFKIVQEIVARAPAIKGWTFTAFRQPSLDDFTIVYENIRMSPHCMFFEAGMEKDSLDVIIYGPNLRNEDRDQVVKYGLITMDNVLGEYDNVMKVRHFEFYDIDQHPDTTTLRPVTQLKSFVDSFYAARHK